MADVQIEDDLLESLRKFADSEHVSLETFLKTLLQRYEVEKMPAESTSQQGWHGEALDSFIGMFDDDIHDLSESVRKSVTDALRNKHARLG